MIYKVQYMLNVMKNVMVKKIDRVGVLWLKSKSRGEDKSGKRLKGKNWGSI